MTAVRMEALPQFTERKRVPQALAEAALARPPHRDCTVRAAGDKGRKPNVDRSSQSGRRSTVCSSAT